MFKRKKKGDAHPQVTQQPQQALKSSIAISPGRIIYIRKTWLITMFLLGFCSSFVMAVWLPNIWSAFYRVFAHFL